MVERERGNHEVEGLDPRERCRFEIELERELIAYCREHLADVKCPRTVDFVDELPRHPTGKLYKRLLKDEYWADAGRTERPRRVTGSFAVLGPGAQEELHAFARRYLDVFGTDVAAWLTERMPLSTPEALHAFLLGLATFADRPLRTLTPVELTGHVPFPRIGQLPYLLTLPGHGFYWFKLCPSEEKP